MNVQGLDQNLRKIERKSKKKCVFSFLNLSSLDRDNWLWLFVQEKNDTEGFRESVALPHQNWTKNAKTSKDSPPRHLLLITLFLSLPFNQITNSVIN